MTDFKHSDHIGGNVISFRPELVRAASQSIDQEWEKPPALAHPGIVARSPCRRGKSHA